MATPVTINTAAVQYGAGVTECHCVIVAETIAGPVAVTKVVPILSVTLADDWTDEDLCKAVAAALNVSAADVTVAEAPTVAAAEPVAEPAAESVVDPAAEPSED